MQERKFSPSIILATFNASDPEVERFLDQQGWAGFRINGVISRYSIEVPYGQEADAQATMEQSGLINKIFDVVKGHPVRGKRRQRKERPSWLND